MLGVLLPQTIVLKPFRELEGRKWLVFVNRHLAEFLQYVVDRGSHPSSPRLRRGKVVRSQWSVVGRHYLIDSVITLFRHFVPGKTGGVGHGELTSQENSSDRRNILPDAVAIFGIAGMELRRTHWPILV